MVTFLKFALGLVLFVITFACVELLLSESWDREGMESHDWLSRSTRMISAELLIATVLVLSLVTIFSVPAIKEEIFVEWSTLGLANVIRLIAAFGLNFFPGYIILAIVGKHELGRLSELITSYFLSLFVLTITGFVSAHIIGVVDGFFLNAFFLVCIALIAVYLFKHFLHKKSRVENSKNFISHRTDFGKRLPILLVGLAVAFMGIWLWWMYSSIGFFIGPPGSDMWRVHNVAQTFLDYQSFRWLHGPWWFSLYLACFTVISGVPSVNAYLALYPLIALSVLSFYLMASNFFKDKRIASISTLSYAIFSGPAWLYALYLRDFNPVISYDKWVQIVFKTGDKFLYQSWYPAFVVGFNAAVVAYASLWWMMYAIWRLDLGNKSNFFLMSIIFVLSYLFHGVDAIVFVVYLAALLMICFLTQNIEGTRRVRLVALSALTGLGIVAFLDVSMTPQYDYFNSISLYALSSRWYYFNSPSFYILTFSLVSIIALTHGKFVESRLMQLHNLIYKKLAPKYASALRRRLAEAVYYLYGVSLLVFVIQFHYLTVATTGYGPVPWYVYPVIGGIPTFLGFAGIVIVLLKWNDIQTKVRDILGFCALSILLLLVFGQTVSFVNEQFFFTRFWERRTLNYIHPVMSLLMAYAMVTLLSPVSVKKPQGIKHLAKICLVSVLTALIVLSSVSSTLIAGDFESRVFFATKPTDEELEALKFLHYSLPLGYKTAYLTRSTGLDYIRAFASDKWTEDRYLWLGQYHHSPSSILSAIRHADIKFLYINRLRDSGELEKNLFLQQLVKVLPKEFENAEVTIYSIPPLRSPAPSSLLGLISSEGKTGETYDTYVLWFMSLMMSGYSYSVITNASDADVFNASETVIVPYDPLPIEQGQLLDWVYNGGHLIMSNTNPYGVFAEMFGLTSKISLVNCDSTENWRALAKRGEISLETTLKVEGAASLRMQNNQSSWEEWIYTPPTSWNLSRYEYLGIWVYGTGGGPRWYLYFTDLNGNERYFSYDLSIFDSATGTYEPSFLGWKLHLIPIREYWGVLDLSAVKNLRIVTGAKLPVNMLIDEIFAFERSKERSVVGVNGIEGMVSIDLPNIEVESLSLGGDAMVIANYTRDGVPVAPFAIQKDLGSGKVTYLNADSFYKSILSEGSVFKAPHEILVKILEIVGIEKPP